MHAIGQANTSVVFNCPAGIEHTYLKRVHLRSCTPYTFCTLSIYAFPLNYDYSDGKLFTEFNDSDIQRKIVRTCHAHTQNEYIHKHSIFRYVFDWISNAAHVCRCSAFVCSTIACKNHIAIFDWVLFGEKNDFVIGSESVARGGVYCVCICACAHVLQLMNSHSTTYVYWYCIYIYIYVLTMLSVVLSA